MCVKEAEREENTMISWSTRIRLCLLYPPLLQLREKARSWITVSGLWSGDRGSGSRENL